MFSLFFFVRASFLAIVLLGEPLLLLLPFVVGLNVVFVRLVELVLLVCKECFAGGLACLLLLLPLRLNLAVMLVDGLTANDILLASVDGHLQPLEDLAHVGMVPINLLLSEGRNYFLDVVDGLVGFELIRLLAINLVFEHALW